MKAMRFGVRLFLMAVVTALSGATGVAQQPPGPPTTAAAEVTPCAQAQMVVDQLLATAMQRLDTARQSNAAADLRAAVDSLQNTMRDARAQLAPCALTQLAAPMDHSKMPMGAAPATGGKPAPAAPMDHSKMPMGTTPAAKPATGAKPPSPAPMDHSRMPMGAAPASKPATGGKPAPAAPMDHSKMPMGAPPAAKPPSGSRPPAPAPMDHSKMPMGKPAETAAQAVDPVCGLKVNPTSAPQATHEGRAYSFCSEQHRELFQKTPAKYLPKGK